jgi:molecular chaperone GrpE
MTDETKTPGHTADPGAGGASGAPAGDSQKAAQAADAGAQPQAGGAEQAASTAGAASTVDAAALSAENSKLEGQIKDLTDRLLRAHADLDNLRKRMEREKEETAKYAITRFAQSIVAVSDNFERAIASVPAAAVTEGSAVKALLDGVSMTEREFLNVLEKHGVKRIDPKGEPFNPHQHQAVMEAQDASVPSGTVTQVFQSGYMIEDRCLRPAMVVVSKGGPKGAKPGEAGDAKANGGSGPGGAENSGNGPADSQAGPGPTGSGQG